MQALAGAGNAGKHLQASSGFAVVPDDQEEKLKLRGGDISQKVPKGAKKPERRAPGKDALQSGYSSPSGFISTWEWPSGTRSVHERGKLSSWWVVVTRWDGTGQDALPANHSASQLSCFGTLLPSSRPARAGTWHCWQLWSCSRGEPGAQEVTGAERKGVRIAAGGLGRRLAISKTCQG